MIEIVTRADVLIRALKMASIVGVVLAIINHGDHILLGTMTATNWIKILITFCVPFCVSTISSVLAIRREQNISH
ncbi:nitrate/nitrite transporter NrtS [Alphaproteobacteria bacterium]|nr:nitrate/nitrite transporter NrtS [Alphaproteobacteria bacterium]